MRNLFILLGLAGVVGFSSCSKDLSELTIENTSEILKKGTWKITLYQDNGQVETSNYASYEFTFDDNGVASATNGSTTQAGSWVSRLDDSSNSLELDLNFTENGIWDDITDDWDVIEQTNTLIKLQDISGGNGDIEYLTFEKQ